jgi:hypothetical protein
MPPYENESLHDMHALMQQLDTLNAAHSPEHLEMFGRGKKEEKPAAAPSDKKDSTSMFSRVTGVFGGNKPAAAPVAESPTDAIWKVLDVNERKTIFENTFKTMMT